MRRPTLPAIAASLLLCLPAMAQTTPAPAAPPAETSGVVDPVVARIGSEEVHASELADAAQNLPEELRGMPPQMLYPMLLDQLIDRRAIIIKARAENLQDDPAVKRQVVRATESAMQNLLLTRVIGPALTEDAIKARYQRDYANKPGEEEVHAAHILVADEAKAKEIIEQIKAGKDFNDLARENSTDPSAKTNAGDLGFFKKSDMLPEFADAAFALKPGEITPAPVHTRFGFHVIKLLERRTAPAPELAQVHDDIRQALIQEGVTKVLAEAKQGLVIQKFNQDGTPLTEIPSPSSQSPATPALTPAAPIPATPTVPAPAK